MRQELVSDHEGRISKEVDILQVLCRGKGNDGTGMVKWEGSVDKGICRDIINPKGLGKCHSEILLQKKLPKIYIYLYK